MSLQDTYDDLDYVNGTIIIVTDNLDINALLAGVFSLNGFKCFKATSAEESIQILDEHKDKVDSMLINGKIAADRGTMLIVNARRRVNDIKIVVVAGSENAKTRVLDYGADDFTGKSMSAEMLVNKVLPQLTKKRR